MKEKITFVAAGDYLPSRRVPAGDRDFAALREVIRGADVRITNLETTISHYEGTYSAFSGGWHLCTQPDRLEDLMDYGFNLVATANNHSLDYGEDGLQITLEYLREYGILNAGCGLNAAEAQRPAFLDTTAGRVALISVASSLVKAWYPGEQSRDMKGRPGANGLQCLNDIRVTPEQYKALKEISDTTCFNNIVNMMVDQGFVNLPQGVLPFGFDVYGFPLGFREVREGETPGMTTIPHPAIQQRLCGDIQNTKQAADFVVVNLHGHEMKTDEIDSVPDFHTIAAHGWIDAGADAVVIEGCHQTRGVEVYGGKPIFYSLGNFVFQCDTVDKTPQDFYTEQGAAPGEGLYQIMERASGNPHWLTSTREVMQSVFAQWSVEEGKMTELLLYPIDLGAGKQRWQNGFPAFSDDEEILNRVIELSKPYGTQFAIDRVTLEDGRTVPVAKVVLG